MATPKITGRNTLRNNFSTGQKPTGANFADLIESFLNLSDDDITTKQVADRKHLGLGTDDPQSPLSIRENNGALMDFSEEGDSSWKMNLVTDSNNEKVLHLGHKTQSNQMTLRKNGNLGIGSQTPDASLHIAAEENADLRIQTSQNSFHVEQNNEGLYLGLGGNANKAVVRHHANTTKKPSEEGADLVVLTNSGQLGCGVEEPAAKLQLKDGDLLVGSVDEGERNIKVSADQLQGQTGAEAGDLSLNSQGGHVGIGTLEPEAPLHIEGDGDKHLLIKGGQGVSAQFQQGDASSAIAYNQNGELNFRPVSQEGLNKVIIDSSLEVKKEEAATLSVRDHQENKVTVVAEDLPSLTLENKDGLGAQLQFSDNNQMMITSSQGGFLPALVINGNVGIGAEEPSCPLDVAGPVRSASYYASHNGNIIRDVEQYYAQSEIAGPLYLVTSLTKGGDVMYRLTLEGYNFLKSDAINTEIVGYTGTDSTLPESPETDFLDETVLNGKIINHAEGVIVTQHYTKTGLLTLKIETDPEFDPHHMGFSVSIWLINQTGSDAGPDLTITHDISEIYVDEQSDETSEEAPEEESTEASN